jgi:hypothetical protein
MESSYKGINLSILRDIEDIQYTIDILTTVSSMLTPEELNCTRLLKANTLATNQIRMDQKIREFESYDVFIQKRILESEIEHLKYMLHQSQHVYGPGYSKRMVDEVNIMQRKIDKYESRMNELNAVDIVLK